jgi:hypothetical protein
MRPEECIYRSRDPFKKCAIRTVKGLFSGVDVSIGSISV